MFKARSRSFRPRSGAAAGDEKEEESAPNLPAAQLPASAQASSGAPAPSVSHKPAKAVLSFGEEEEAEVVAVRMRPFQRSSAARDVETRDKEAQSAPAVVQSAYRPAAGEYTAERLAELRKNSFFYSSDAPRGATAPAAASEGDQKVTHASHDRRVHFAEEPMETAAGEEAERLEKASLGAPSSDALSQLAALREGGAVDGADKAMEAKRSDVARMQRSRARSAENSGFISLDSSKPEGDDSSGRLLAEDEHDAEEEAFDDYAGRSIAFGPAAQARAQKVKRKEAVEDVAAQEEDEEQLKWETDQMRKAAGRQMTGAQAALVAAATNRERGETLPSSFPALPSLDTDSRVADALAELRLRHTQHQRERHEAVESQRLAQQAAGETEAALRSAQKQCDFFHTFRLFLTPMLSCLTHKVPQLEALAITVTTASSAVRDARAALQIDWTPTATDFHFTDSEEQTDAEAAARSPALNDALNQRVAAEAQVRALFADASSEYTEVSPLLERMAQWRREYGPLFAEAYAAVALKNLVAPYLRRDLLIWRPLDDVPTPLDSLPSFRAAADFAATTNAAEGSDEALLLPRLVESDVAPRAAHLLSVYRPLSGRQTQRALALFAELADEPLPVLRPLATAALEALKSTVIALLASEEEHATSASPSLRFWRLAKLYRHVCAWHQYLAAVSLQHLALEMLLPRIVAVLPSMPPPACVALLDATPTAWLATGLPQWTTLRKALTDILRRPALSTSDTSAFSELLGRLPR